MAREKGMGCGENPRCKDQRAGSLARRKPPDVPREVEIMKEERIDREEKEEGPKTTKLTLRTASGPQKTKKISTCKKLAWI